MSKHKKKQKGLAILLITALLISTMQPLIMEVAYAAKKDKLAWDEYKVSKDGKTVYIDPDDYEGDTLYDRQDNAGDALIVALREIQTSNSGETRADTIIIQGDIRVNEGQNQSSWNPTAASISVTIKGDGKPTIWVENYHNYFLRGYRSNITLENLVIDGSGNNRIMQGGCLYGEDAKFTLKNVTIQNFNKRGAYDDGLSAPDNDYDYGNKGEDIFGGAAVMLFTESFYGDTANQTPYSSFKMDANSKILNCHSYEAGGDASVDYDFGAIGGAVYLEGLALNYPMEVELNGEINGGNGSAVYAKWCDISMGNNAYIHNAEGKYGGAIQLSGSGLTMNGSKIENCTGTYGGAIYVDAGEQRNLLKGASTTTQMKVISLNSGTIQNCTAKQGGAVYLVD